MSALRPYPSEDDPSPRPLVARPEDSVRIILDRIGEKWSVLIILGLADGPKRFGQLRTNIGEISQRMLTTTLRNLLRDGLLERQVFPTIPPSVEYSLSSLGTSFLEPMRALREWSLAAHWQVQAARAAYDAEGAEPRSRASGRPCARTPVQHQRMVAAVKRAAAAG